MKKSNHALKTIITLLCSIIATSASFALGGSTFGFIANEPIRLNTPIAVYASFDLNEPDKNASIDVTIPPGASVLEGNLHWNGPLEKYPHGELYYHTERLMVQIDQPGIYEFSASFNLPNLSLDNVVFPFVRRFFIYVRADTGLIAFDRKSLEESIRDSTIVPQKVLDERRRQKELFTPMAIEYKDSIDKMKERFYWYSATAHEEKNGVPITINGFPLSALSNSVTDSTLPYHYSLTQIRNIRFKNLLFSPPRIDCESIIANATDVFPELTLLSKSEQIEFGRLGARQLRELYEYDQKLLLSFGCPENTRYTDNRNELLLRQKEEVRRILKQPER